MNEPSIEINWPDGMHHVWRPELDGTWTLTLTDPGAHQSGPLPRITGYDAPNICRVVAEAVSRISVRGES